MITIILCGIVDNFVQGEMAFKQHLLNYSSKSTRYELHNWFSSNIFRNLKNIELVSNPESNDDITFL